MQFDNIFYKLFLRIHSKQNQRIQFDTIYYESFLRIYFLPSLLINGMEGVQPGDCDGSKFTGQGVSDLTDKFMMDYNPDEVTEVTTFQV